MPSISPKDLKLLDTLSKEYRIVFKGDVQPREWPECHRTVLEQVSELGEKKFSSYAIDPSVTDAGPWKSDLKHLADNLVERANRNRQRNESSWRISCEPFVFARLSGEVACRNCRKRIWRSEIEASCHNDSQRELALQKRRKAREPCRCPRIARSQDHLEAIGLNRIFGHREDETVRHDPTIAKKLGKKIQRPDAIFGLRQTRNIENLLHDTRRRQLGHDAQIHAKQLHEELQPSPVDQPLDQNGDELLYPFLVLEAKSSTSDCDWYSIQMQAAFPIRTFLETQHRLRTAADSLEQSQSAPLVWFFANRGEDWRVSVAFMAEGRQRPNTIGHTDYIIIDVWRGSIATLDGALQLLLLVDYVFDWARDIYREDILKKLRLLASGDNDAASVLYSDTDIFSTRYVDQPEVHSPGAGNEDYQAYVSAQNRFVAYDTEFGVVRHATFVESRYCCVFATRDNVRTMLQSTRRTRTQKFCCVILEQMSDAILLDQSVIEAMEERWTGTVRMTPAVLASKTKFYTIISCTNYLSASWHQVRELYVIAIADDAWDAVVGGSNLKPKRGKTQRPPLSEGADVNDLLEKIDRLQAGTPGDTLLACITRRAIKLRLVPDFSFCESINSPTEASADRSSPTRTVIHPDASDGVLRDIVHDMYISLKKGSLEPQESFLRLSKRFNKQHLLPQNKEPLYPGSTSPETLQVSDDSCVLVHSRCHPHDPEKSPSDICLYLVNGDPITPTEQEIAERTKRTFETRDVYHTTQNNGTSNVAMRSQKSSARTPWNLQGTYGICSQSYKFTNSILERCAMLTAPSRQGSPRVPDGAASGVYLYKRTLIHWKDPRWPSIEPKRWMLFIYKLMSREIRYWKEVAAARKAEGSWACAWCAKVGDETQRDCVICHECSTVSEDDEMYDWFRNSLMGEPAFTVVEGEEYSDVREDWYESYPEELPPSNARWNQALHGYPALDEPFEDMAELYQQCRNFATWTMTRPSERELNHFMPSQKRPRLDSESEAQHNDLEGSKSSAADGGPESPRTKANMDIDD